MEKNLLKSSKLFLDSFVTPLNWCKLKQNLTQISKLFCASNMCKCNAKIFFVDKKFSISASMKNDKIYFNRLRIHTLNHLHIDCEDKNHMKNIYAFYNNYSKFAKHSRFEVAFYDFMSEYIQFGYEEDLKSLGSYKFIKYEILETIFHESQHMIQNEVFMNFDNKIYNINQLLLAFSVAYEKLYEFLSKNNIALNFERDNFRYPVEIDARYTAMKCLNEIKQKFYTNDNNFSKHIISSSIVPNDINLEEIANQIFVEYQNMYKKYIGISINDQFCKLNDCIIKYKAYLTKEMIKRYQDIENIIKLNRSQIV